MKEFNEHPDPSQWDSEKLYQVACDYYRYWQSLEEKLIVLQKCPSCFIELQ
jgi:hypothetical protein